MAEGGNPSSVGDPGPKSVAAANAAAAEKEKAGQIEKGEETAAGAAAAEVDPEKTDFVVGARVACLSTWDNLYHSAEVVDRREVKAGFEYYVHYLEYNKRLDEWLPSTRVEKWRPDIVPPLKSAMGEKLSPLAIPASPGLVGSGAADTQRDTPGTADRKLTRNLKRRYDEIHNVTKPMEEMAPLDQSLEKEHEEKTKVKNIQMVELGRYEIDTWYYSPYPEEYCKERKLFICEFCLKYMRKKFSLERHKLKCGLRQPPGNEIYKMTAPFVEQVPISGGTRMEDLPTTTGAGRMQHLSMFEVDGKNSKLYCQNLCLLAKLFLDHKTLYYDVDSFLFYILTENDVFGSHLVGYFSKEKYSAEDYNLACILTLPPFQRKGYGRFLITFAYELSKKEGKVGTPERPLSDLGQVSFRSYWTRVLLEILRDHQNVSIKDLTAMTSIRYEDVVNTLQTLNLIKYWKGQYIISVTAKHIDEHLKNLSSQTNWTIDASKLNWTPGIPPPARRPK